jgi:ADP-ribose pyrophosphatase YjhB (NUDIX family)
MSSSREYPQRPLVGIGVVLFRPGDVLLIRRGRPPAQGEWSFPGGAQRLGETAEAAARRELYEETGLHAGPLALATYADSIHRDGDGTLRFHYTILDFCGLWQGGEPRAGGDAQAVAWAPLAALDRFDLAEPISAVIALCAQRLSMFDVAAKQPR